MHIRQVEPNSRRDVERFVRLPFRLYRGHSLWVPPFLHEMRAQLDPRRHPFYRHSQAAFFLAFEGDEAVGRIAVLDNARHNAHHGTQTAFFYHFDCVDDPVASRALVEAAAGWARQRGLDRLWGPKGLSHIDGQGVLVEGFEHPPAMGVPYNYPYYSALLEDAGFVRVLGFESWLLDRSYHFPARYLEAAEKIKARRGLCSVVFRTKDDLRALIPEITRVYNESFVEVQGYTPLSEAEARAIGERVLSVADPKLVKVLMHGDELVGFVLAYPDLSAAIRRCRGSLWPTGWLHLLRESKRTRWINVNGMGIRQAYRGLGGTAILYAELYHVLIDHPQYDFGDLVQAQETNARMMQEVASLGPRPYKRHAVYELRLG